MARTRKRQTRKRRRGSPAQRAALALRRGASTDESSQGESIMTRRRTRRTSRRRRTTTPRAGLGLGGFNIRDAAPVAVGATAGFLVAERGREALGRNIELFRADHGAIIAEAALGLVGGMVLRPMHPGLARAFVAGSLARAGVSLVAMLRRPRSGSGVSGYIGTVDAPADYSALGYGGDHEYAALGDAGDTINVEASDAAYSEN